MGLPDVKAVDEYHERFSNIYKDKHKREELVQTRTDLPLFYKEPKKRVKLSSPADDLKVVSYHPSELITYFIPRVSLAVMRVLGPPLHQLTTQRRTAS